MSYDGALSDPFEIQSDVKEGCVLAPTLFGIFFSLLLNFAFQHSDEGVYLHTRSDAKLFNLSRLKAKTKVCTVLLREILFANDAALTSDTEEGLSGSYKRNAVNSRGRYTLPLLTSRRLLTL